MFDVEKLPGRSAVPFLVSFIILVIASGLFIAKIGELIGYQEDVERAVQLSRETPEVQRYLARYSDAQYRVRDDENYWFVHWSAPLSYTLHVVIVTIDKTSWKVISVVEAI